MANLDTVCIPCRVVEEALQSGSVALRAMLRKDCIACARSLPLTEFWHRRSGGRPGKDGGKGGRQKVCKQCTAEGKGGYTLKTTTK